MKYDIVQSRSGNYIGAFNVNNNLPACCGSRKLDTTKKCILQLGPLSAKT